MPIAFNQDQAQLTGICGAEVAEPLLGWLADRDKPGVDLVGCKHLHAAVLQVLLVSRPEICGEPADPFLRDHVAPLLRQGTSSPAD